MFQPQIDLNDLSAFKSPEDFVRASKKGKSTMLFAKVERFLIESNWPPWNLTIRI